MTKRKSIESVDVNQWIAACGVILGLLLEAIIGSYSWMETGPMIRFQSGVRLPVIGPLLGGILAYLFALRFGEVKIRGMLKHSIVGAIVGLLIGYFLGARVLAPMLAQRIRTTASSEVRLPPAIHVFLSCTACLCVRS